MHDIPEEAVKVALDTWRDHEFDGTLDYPRMRNALTAALPFLPALEPSAARELALEEAHSDLINRLNDDIEQLERVAEQAKFAGRETGVRVKSPSVLLTDLRDAAAAIHALASHPVADKPDEAGAQGEADVLTHFWRPISEADKSITFEQTYDIGDGEKMTIRNSDHYWVRDADGRVYEATWSDHKAGYWWDLEGESPVDPVEYMPHPLSIPTPPSGEVA